MNELTDEKFLITKAKSAQKLDPFAAKAWIIAAKTLYPNDFGVQFEAYLLEKAAGNYEEAAKCFSYILMTFQTQPPELWHEISQLTEALRIPEGSTTPDQDFYVKIFQYISYEVQHKILLLTANHSDNNLEHCRLILLLLKRFPQAIATHAPRLLETIIQGITTSPTEFREMLVLEALPLIFSKPTELPNVLVNRIMAFCLEYYINEMFRKTEDNLTTVTDCWRKIFDVLELCGKLLKWEQFLPYNKTWSKDVYWQKLIQIVSSAPPRPSENKQILFCCTILFVMSLQEYMNVVLESNYTDSRLILLEGFKDAPPENSKRRKQEIIIETIPPQISVNSPCNSETPVCLVTAAHCWQLLHSNEILQIDFSQLLMNFPINAWVDRFLFDLAVYLGRTDDVSVLLSNPTNLGAVSNLENRLRHLSLSLSQGNINAGMFDIILEILSKLPLVTGDFIQKISITSHGRHLLLLPLTRKAVVQYCTKAIIFALKQKVQDTNCTDMTMGNLLVLLQLNWPQEIQLAEVIFDIIRARRSFSYLLFPMYIINVDIIEEFTHMWYPHGGELQLEFIPPQPNIGQRRIGTRGADKGVKEDFKHFIKQQISRCNEEIDLLIVGFIQHEYPRLVQSLIDK